MTQVIARVHPVHLTNVTIISPERDRFIMVEQCEDSIRSFRANKRAYVKIPLMAIVLMIIFVDERRK